VDAYAVHMAIKDGRKVEKEKTTTKEDGKEQDGLIHER